MGKNPTFRQGTKKPSINATTHSSAPPPSFTQHTASCSLLTHFMSISDGKSRVSASCYRNSRGAVRPNPENWRRVFRTYSGFYWYWSIYFPVGLERSSRCCKCLALLSFLPSLKHVRKKTWLQSWRRWFKNGAECLFFVRFVLAWSCFAAVWTILSTYNTFHEGVTVEMKGI